MKISILIYSLAAGGAERIVSILLKKLSQKYLVELILMNDTIFFEVPNNVKTTFLEKSNPKESGLIKFLKLPFLAYKYSKIKSDVSISFMNRPNYINILSNFFKKSKTIISERIAPSQEYKTNNLKDKISKFLIKFLYQKADIVVPNAKYIGYELETIFLVPKEKLKVIYNPISKTQNLKTKTKNSKFIFIQIGRMEKQKNHKLLISAFNKLDIDAELWLIGDGYLRTELQKIANKKVKFLGRQKDIFKYLSKADCFLLTSDYEGFPNVILEALACGLPVISTDCRSGPREILAPNTDFRYETKDIEFAEYGILVPVGDIGIMSEAMRLIYENYELREKYRKKALERAKEFNIDKIIKKWEKLIND